MKRAHQHKSRKHLAGYRLREGTICKYTWDCRRLQLREGAPYRVLSVQLNAGEAMGLFLLAQECRLVDRLRVDQGYLLRSPTYLAPVVQQHDGVVIAHVSKI